jgi:hypothetical protein
LKILRLQLKEEHRRFRAQAKKHKQAVILSAAKDLLFSMGRINALHRPTLSHYAEHTDFMKNKDDYAI